MRIDDTIYKDDKKNYKTKGFKVIETCGQNGAAKVKKLCALDLVILTTYALKVPLITSKHLGLFYRVLKGTAKTQSEEAFQ